MKTKINNKGPILTQAYPLHWPEGWPRTKRPERSRFKVTLAKARDGVMAQIRHLGGVNVVMSTNVQLRRDGLPYANQAEPIDAGVSVYFQYGKKQMVFACDRWGKVSENMRAIEKTIEAIRGMERWGASDMMERAFSAFEALPAPGGWRDDLGVKPDATADDVKRRYHDLAKTHHPDRGGDADQFQRINRAYETGLRELTE